MGFIGDWIIFSFKILVSGLLSGSIGWQLTNKVSGIDLRAYVITGILSTMLVVSVQHSDKSSQDIMLGFVIGGILVAVALISTKLNSDSVSGSGIFTGIKLIYAASLGVMVGAGRIVEAIIAALVVYIVLNHLDIGRNSSEDDIDS